MIVEWWRTAIARQSGLGSNNRISVCRRPNLRFNRWIFSMSGTRTRNGNSHLVNGGWFVNGLSPLCTSPGRCLLSCLNFEKKETRFRWPDEFERYTQLYFGDKNNYQFPTWRRSVGQSKRKHSKLDSRYVRCAWSIYFVCVFVFVQRVQLFFDRIAMALIIT